MTDPKFQFRLGNRMRIGSFRSSRFIVSAAAIAVAISVSTTLSPAAASRATTDDSSDPVEQQELAHQMLDFAHPVSLNSAASLDSTVGVPIEGFRFESDSIVGDYWVDGGLSVAEFLDETERATGTFPEVVGAYVDAKLYERARADRSRSAEMGLGERLPVYDAPDADLELVQSQVANSSKDSATSLASAAAQTWQPNDAAITIGPLGSDNLAITAKYDWWSSSPFASPLVMADHWGMEFQVDFYTAMRPNWIGSPLPIGYGARPHCGATDTLYKDWAAASTRPFDWFGWVMYGPDIVYAPGSLGLYGDYNDSTDACTTSSIAVGMAAPRAIPTGDGGINHLSLYIYPLRGEDSTSKISAAVQPVSRVHCELNPSMPLTDCMGVAPGTYPGPGKASERGVLNSWRNWTAPSRCWYSPDFGDEDPTQWAC